MEKTEQEKARIAYGAMQTEINTIKTSKGFNSAALHMQMALSELSEESLARLYDFVRKA